MKRWKSGEFCFVNSSILKKNKKIKTKFSNQKNLKKNLNILFCQQQSVQILCWLSLSSFWLPVEEDLKTRLPQKNLRRLKNLIATKKLCIFPRFNVIVGLELSVQQKLARAPMLQYLYDGRITSPSSPLWWPACWCMQRKLMHCAWLRIITHFCVLFHIITYYCANYCMGKTGTGQCLSVDTTKDQDDSRCFQRWVYQKNIHLVRSFALE